MHNSKPQIVNEISNAHWNDNWLIGRNLSQSSPIEMVKMRVSDQHVIDLRQMMNLKTRRLEAFYYFQPKRPNRIDEHVDFVRLD